jgi:ubiquinone/menaquinone biosynthesis C-methylase UbiE
MREKTFRNALLNQFKNKVPQKILDIGCGTGTLALMIKAQHPETVVVGIDGDPKILEFARSKAKNEDLDFNLSRAYSTNLPFENDTFDLATNTMMLHHLSDRDKVKTLQEAHRVLKRNGEINIADWGSPSSILTSGGYYVIQYLDGFDTTESNKKGKIFDYLKEAGFGSVEEERRIDTVLGTISLHRGIKT